MKLPDLSKAETYTRFLFTHEPPFCPDVEHFFINAVDAGTLETRTGIKLVVPVVSYDFEGELKAWHFADTVNEIHQTPYDHLGRSWGLVKDSGLANNLIATPLGTNPVFLAARPLRADSRLFDHQTPVFDSDLLYWDGDEWFEFRRKLVDNLQDWGIL